MQIINAAYQQFGKTIHLLPVAALFTLSQDWPYVGEEADGTWLSSAQQMFIFGARHAFPFQVPWFFCEELG